MAATTVGSIVRGKAITCTSANSPVSIILGQSDNTVVCSWVFQTKCSDWTTNSIAVKGRLTSPDLVAATDDVAQPYQRDGAASDVAAGTAIATNDIYYVRGDFKTVTLIVTVGGVDVTVVPNGGPG